MLLRTFLATIAAGTALFGATVAHAGTHWSVGISLPIPGVVVSNGGYYAEPAPVYYAPVPRYVAAEPYYEAPRAYAPPRAVYSPEVVYRDSYRGWTGDRDSRWERRRGFERARWEHERREHRRDDADGHRWRRD